LDDFVYTATSQSTPNARDTIVDFAKGSEAENIVLTAIDANTSATAAGDQAFVLGGAFTAGHIRQTQQGANLLIEGNTDSDSTAELAILLLAVTGALGVEDFAL
jgi:hypothetical protein